MERWEISSGAAGLAPTMDDDVVVNPPSNSTVENQIAALFILVSPSACDGF
jgi:hypothetical protein